MQPPVNRKPGIIRQAKDSSFGHHKMLKLREPVDFPSSSFTLSIVIPVFRSSSQEP